MMRLTLAVVGKTLFGVDVEGAASDVGHSLETMMRWTMNLISPYGFILDRCPCRATAPSGRGSPSSTPSSTG